MKNPASKRRNGIKGSTIRKAGFTSGVFALSPEVKERLDQLLKYGYSPEKALRTLSSEFADTPLPSRSATYTYKAKYFEQNITSSTNMVKTEENLDLEKVKIKGLLLDHIKRFLVSDVLTLRDNWLSSVERDKIIGLDNKDTRDKEKSYVDALRLCADLVPKLNINIELKEDKEPEQVNAADLSAKLARIIVKRSTQIAIKSQNNSL